MFICVLISLLEIKSFVSLESESLLFWMRIHFNGGVKFSKILRKLLIKGGSDKFRFFLGGGEGGLGKKGSGQYFRVGLIPWRPL